jgi:hypothetical protein
VEIPPAAIKIGKKRFPVGGGGTLRILPDFFLSWARNHYMKEGFPPVIYIHPWEFVPEHKIQLPWKLQQIHYWGLKKVEKKMRNMLRKHPTITMQEYYLKLKKTK